ncbi:putative ubiquitin-conjugating enzyme E2 [Trichinella spiralis]
MLKFGVELALWENGLGQADEGKGGAGVRPFARHLHFSSFLSVSFLHDAFFHAIFYASAKDGIVGRQAGSVGQIRPSDKLLAV